MGNPISSALKDSENQQVEDEKHKSKETLEMLQIMAQKQIEIFKGNVNSEIMETPAIKTVCPIYQTQEITISDGSDIKIGDAVDKIVDNVFSGNFLGAIKDSVTTAVGAILSGSYTGEEKQQKDFVITYENATLIRCDFMVYRYSFSSKNGLGKYAESVIAYWTQKTLCSDKNSDPQVLMYYLTQLCAKDPKGKTHLIQCLQDDIDIASQLMKTIQIINTVQENPLTNISAFSNNSTTKNSTKKVFKLGDPNESKQDN